MFMLIACLPALALLWALGGRLGRLIDYEFRFLWLIWLGLAAQLILFTPAGGAIPAGTVKVAHVLTYVPVLLFLALNRTAGLSLLALGATSNFVAIAANGGVMPTDPHAQELIFGLTQTKDFHLNTDPTADRLLILGDVMALPPWFPLANAFSIGDLLLAVGIVWAIARLTVSPPSDAPTRRSMIDAVRATAQASARPVFIHVAAWAAIAATLGHILASTRSLVAATVLVTASLALLLPQDSAHRLATVIMTIGCVAIALTALTIDVALPLAAAVATIAAVAMIRLAPISTSSGADSLGPMVVRIGTAAAGISLGTAMLGTLGLATTLAVVGAAMIIWAFTCLPLARRRHEPRRPATPDDLDLMAPLTLACTALGSAAVAAPLVSVTRLELGVWSLGIVAGAFAVGLLAGLLMASQLTSGSNPRALGLMLVFMGMSVGLVASSHVPMTVVGSALVLGLSVGGAVWLVARSLSPSLVTIGWFALVGGAALGAVAGTRSAPEIAWAASVPLIGLGIVTMASTIGQRVVPIEVTA